MTPMVSTLKIPHFQPLIPKLVGGCLLSIGLCLAGITSSEALTLSRPQIQSSIGAPLKVEIDVTNLSDEESVDLQADLAEALNYKANGIAINTALEDAKLELLTRADQSKFLRIIGIHPVSDPYVELIINLKWATGSILRNFGLYIGSEPGTDPKVVQTPSSTSPKTLSVKSGDTASKIALRNMDKTQLSLDQMLVALLNKNPDAFIQKNVNLVKAGAELKIPSTDEALAISKDEANSEVTLQAKAFANYRSTLASKLPQSALNNQDKSNAGKVGGKVKDLAPAPKDQLKLSAPAINADTEKLPKEESIAQQKQAEVNAGRRQDLLQNIADLSKLAESTGLEIKSGILSGLPYLVKINSLDDLIAWGRTNYELVLVCCFVLGCFLLLLVWAWINKKTIQEPNNTHESTEDSEYAVSPTLEPHSDDIHHSPVFAPLPDSVPHEHSHSGEDEHIEMSKTAPLGNTEREPQHQNQPIKFDFDLNISSDEVRESFTREPQSPVLTPAKNQENVSAQTLNTTNTNTYTQNQTHTNAHITSKHSEPNKANSEYEQEDPFRVRLDLAEELWKLGQKHTGRALAQEVAEQAGEQMREIALRWLSEHP